jgi:hypothetical protein
VPEHAVTHQRLERRAREVGRVAHDEKVREAVAAQFTDGVFGHRQGLVVGRERAGFMHRTDLHADFRRLDLVEDGLDDLEENAGAPLDLAAIFVSPSIGRLVEELRQQIEVVRLDLHAVEACNHRVARSASVVGHGPADVVPCHRTRHDGGNVARCRDGYLPGIDVGGRDRLRAAAQVRMRNGARMPELGDNAPAGSVDGIGQAAPAANLLFGPQARRIRPTEPLRADRDPFGHDQAGCGALGIVFGLQRGRHLVIRPGAHSGKRRHDDPIGQIEITHPIGRKQRLGRHERFPSSRQLREGKHRSRRPGPVAPKVR